MKNQKQTKVVLAAVQLPGSSDSEHEASLNELERLCQTLGFITLGRVSQRRRSMATGTILGEGKLQELASWTGGPGVVRGFSRGKAEDLDEGDEQEEEDEPELDVKDEQAKAKSGKEKATLVVFDSEITPTQLKNLEEATGVEVLDRTGIILEIFSRHARSREARLQVEIAKLSYLAPRLRASHVGGDRQGGGIGAKGAGESAHELDRRRIRDRIAELRGQLTAIQSEQSTRRANRREAPVVALVGYTNAGKSSLMRALTSSEVLVEDKLFATLDTTVRALQPETVPRILISDTVGFIKKLPHDLVASFRSTLDEAAAATLLLFVVDASDPSFRSQLEVTQKVLSEIVSDQQVRRLVLNKIDRLSAEELAKIQAEYPDALLCSTRNRADIQRLREIILGIFEEGMVDREHMIPYAQGRVLGMIRERARVLGEQHEDEGTLVLVRAHEEEHRWIEKQLTLSL